MSGLEVGARLVGVGLFVALFGLLIDFVLEATMNSYPDEKKKDDE